MTISHESARVIIRDILQEILDDDSQLSGFGEYGRGWNDKSESVKMKVRELMKEWKGGSHE
jgi:lysozyme family protein